MQRGDCVDTVQIKYVYRYRMKTDTLFIERTDSIYEEKAVPYIPDGYYKKTWKDKVFDGTGTVGIIGFVILLAFFLIRKT
jgi:hypothetical protein